MQTAMSEKNGWGQDKVKRYGWIIKDQPGELRTLAKEVLQIHPAYQREAIQSKVLEMASAWSWVGAGAIVVGERGGEFWVIDGQHRVLAARRRSDITHLPCVVFQTEGVRQEAVAFLDLNTGRKPVSSIGRFKAMIAAGDAAACVVQEVLAELGVTAKANATKGREMKSVGWAVKRAAEDAEKFRLVMRTAVAISEDAPIQQKLLDGLWYLNERLPGGIAEARLAARLQKIGARRLVEAASKAAAYFVSGGAAVWAQGMLDEINKGLRNRYEMRGD